jgi:hypothetical protein
MAMALCQVVYGPFSRALLPGEARRAAADVLHAACTTLGPDMTLEAFSVPLARPECPAWLRGACSRYLSVCVTQPGGVYALLAQMLAAAHTDEAAQTIALRAGDVIAPCPAWVKAPDAYYGPVAGQLHALLHMQTATRDALPRRVVLAAVAIIHRMLDAAPDHARRTLIASRMCKALRSPAECDEQGLQQCVEDMHRVFVAAPRGADHIAVLGPYVATLLELHLFVRTTASGLRVATREVIAAYLRILPGPDAARLLLQWVLPAAAHGEGGLGSAGTFAWGDGGGVVMQAQARAEGGGPGTAAGHQGPARAEAVADLLEALKHTSVPGDYFVALVDELVRVAKDADGLAAREPRPGGMPRNYLEVGGAAGDGDEEKDGETRGAVYLGVLQGAVKLAEAMGVAVLSRVAHVIRFAQLLAGAGDADETAMALALLTAMLSGAVEIAADDEAQIAALHGWLEPYMHHPAEQVREMANDLRASIRTRDPSWSTALTQAQAGLPGGESGPVAGPRATLATALLDLRDTMVPVRAHGLITLRRLVRERDPSTVGHVDKIYELYDSNIRQSDSYLYLNAIHGMAELACVYPVPVLDRVAAVFADRGRAEEDRLKYGEVVSKAIEQCAGPVMRPYVPAVTARLLHMVDLDLDPDPDAGPREAEAEAESPFVHASALAALAMLCRVHGPDMHAHIKVCVWRQGLWSADAGAGLTKASPATVFAGHCGLRQRDDAGVHGRRRPANGNGDGQRAPAAPGPGPGPGTFIRRARAVRQRETRGTWMLLMARVARARWHAGT